MSLEDFDLSFSMMSKSEEEREGEKMREKETQTEIKSSEVDGVFLTSFGTSIGLRRYDFSG